MKDDEKWWKMMRFRPHRGLTPFIPPKNIWLSLTSFMGYGHKLKWRPKLDTGKKAPAWFSWTAGWPIARQVLEKKLLLDLLLTFLAWGLRVPWVDSFLQAPVLQSSSGYDAPRISGILFIISSASHHIIVLSSSFKIKKKNFSANMELDEDQTYVLAWKIGDTMM